MGLTIGTGRKSSLLSLTEEDILTPTEAVRVTETTETVRVTFNRDFF